MHTRATLVRGPLALHQVQPMVPMGCPMIDPASDCTHTAWYETSSLADPQQTYLCTQCREQRYEEWDADMDWTEAWERLE